MTSKLTREQRINEVKELIANAEKWAGFYEHPIHDKTQREMFEGMAKVMSEHLASLAAMDSEPVAIIDQANLDYLRSGADADVWPPEREEMGDVLLYRHAQPAPVAQKEPISFDEWSRKCALQITLCYPDFREKAQYIWDSARETQQPAPLVPEEKPMPNPLSMYAVDAVAAIAEAKGWNACRAAMLQAKAEPVSLHPELSVWYGDMPETNGKTNWTAILHRKGECLSTGITIDRSEYPDRVRYEADRMRYLIGELEDEPDILEYDADAHSGYVPLAAAPGNYPVIPDGYVMVPVPDEFLSAEQNASGMFELSEDCMCRLAVALSQQSKGLVTPPGYVMVPKEPTEDMCFAPDVRVGNKTWDGYQSSADMAECKAIYVAMLAAAPQEVKGE